MTHFTKTFRASLLTGCMLFGIASAATAAPDDVIATVDGVAVYERDIDQIGEQFGEQLGNVSDDQRRTILTDIMIDLLLTVKAAQDAGIDETDDFKSQMAFLERQALRAGFLDRISEERVTDGMLRGMYSEQIGRIPDEEEVRARHILVETEDEAKAIITELDGGADFVELAKEKSTGPSGPNGGELGFFGRGRMVPEFEAAAFELEAGSYTKAPVKSQFGWHIILTEEKRMKPKPTFEQVEGQLREAAFRQVFTQVMEELRSAATIEKTAE